jgi:general secretion pathway protein I
VHRFSHRNPFRSGGRGFTLLEVLLAFVVFAVSFAMVLQILSGSMRSTVRAREYTEAALLAQSIMDMVGMEVPLEPVNLAGEEPGDYRWSLVIVDYEPGTVDDRTLEVAEVMGTRVYWVGLDIEWGEGRLQRNVRFSSIRSVLESRQ